MVHIILIFDLQIDKSSLNVSMPVGVELKPIHVSTL